MDLKRGEQMRAINQEHTERYSIYHADCVEIVSQLPNESVDYSIFSPPFSNLFTYSNSDRDMGNSKTDEEFFYHFKFLVKELYRVIKLGRLVSIHCMNIPAMKEKDGYIGIKDFRGDIIRAFQEAGFIYHAEVVIFKDPLIEATRTKALGLMHKQLCKDSSMCRQGLPDYIVTMRKPGENAEFIKHEEGFSEYFGSGTFKDGSVLAHEIWRRYASPVWWDIRQTYTLNHDNAKENMQERHICPLQHDTINRCLALWSNPDDIVLTPFMGIGSEIYNAVKMGRKGIGIELKESYFNCAYEHMKRALDSHLNGEPKEMSIEDFMGDDDE